jgi:ATP-dependent RNA helicase RhlE
MSRPRGIHVEGIAHVVNYDLPQVPEDFIHRIGRTGRMGASGRASTFATPSERAGISHIERTIKTKLTRRHVSPDLEREQKPISAVIVLPSALIKPAASQFVPPRTKGGRRREV